MIIAWYCHLLIQAYAEVLFFSYAAFHILKCIVRFPAVMFRVCISFGFSMPDKDDSFGFHNYSFSQVFKKLALKLESDISFTRIDEFPGGNNFRFFWLSSRTMTQLKSSTVLTSTGG